MQNKSLSGRDLRNAVLFAALVYLGIEFIAQIASVLLVFSVSAILVVALNPAVSWLQKRKIPRQVSAGVLALSVIGAAALVFLIVIPPAIDQLQDLYKQGPQFVESVKGKVELLTAKYPELENYIPKQIPVSKESAAAVSRVLLGGASAITTSAVASLTAAFLIFIVTIYALANPDQLTGGFLRMLSPENRRKAEAAGARIGTQIRAWAIGILIGMVFIFLFTWIGLLIIGVKQAFLFAVIAGLLEAVPILGPILSAVPPTVVSLIGNPIQALWVVLVFVVIQQIEGNVLIPIIMSKQLSLHPVTIIFAVVVMGGLFGIVGVFLAAPASAITGILIDEFYLKPREAADQ